MMLRRTSLGFEVKGACCIFRSSFRNSKFKHQHICRTHNITPITFSTSTSFARIPTSSMVWLCFHNVNRQSSSRCVNEITFALVCERCQNQGRTPSFRPRQCLGPPNRVHFANIRCTSCLLVQAFVCLRSAILVYLSGLYST